MKEGTGSKFVIGLLFGAMIGALVWYWQKSTSAEDGALALLDRLAGAEARLREMKSIHRTDFERQAEVESRVAEVVQSKEAGTVDDLQSVKGIGPAFERRLLDADVHALAQLGALEAEVLAQILGVSTVRAQAILAEVAA